MPTSACHLPSGRNGLRLILMAAVVLSWLGGIRCAAHPATIAAATAKVQPDGHFEIQARFDVLAFVLDDTPVRIGDAPMNALLDGPGPALQSQLAEAAARFRRDFRVSDGTGPGTVDSVTFPGVADVQAWCNSGVKPRLPVMIPVIIQGHLPPGATSISFRFPDVLGMMVVTTEFPFREPASEPVEAGAFSTPLPLTVAAPPPTAITAALLPAAPALAPPPPARVAVAPPAPKASSAAQTPPAPQPVARKVAAATVGEAKAPLGMEAGTASRPELKSGAASGPGLKSWAASEKTARLRGRGSSPPAPSVPSAPAQAGSPRLAAQDFSPGPTEQTPSPARLTLSATPPVPWIVVFLRYVQMGFHHIMPEGLDHILFVLGLFLLSSKLKPLLWQITAFTVAHSLTLALSLYGVLRLPSSIVEPVIAASIAFVAIENLFTTDLKPWRTFVVFGFGLVHGMGFAGALLDLGLPRHDYLTALVGFNAGVELGQLSVVALALLAVGWFRSRPSYRRLVVVPASVTIAAVALFWTFQRVLSATQG